MLTYVAYVYAATNCDKLSGASISNGTVSLPHCRNRCRFHRKRSAIAPRTNCSMACWACCMGPRRFRKVMSQFASTQPCSGPLGARAVRSSRPLPAPCRPVRPRPLPNSTGYRGITSSAMARRRTIGSPSACCGSMSMSRPCPLAARPRAVSGPGWGATAARRGGKCCGAPPATTETCSRRHCCGAQPASRSRGRGR